jgi:hypothetical protein
LAHAYQQVVNQPGGNDMQKRYVQTAPIAVLAALAVVGCGSSSNHLNKAQYADRANTICKQAATATVSARAALDKLPPPKPGAHMTAAQLAEAAQAENTEAAAMKTVATKIRALGTPSTNANLAGEVSSGFALIAADQAALAHAAASHSIHAIAAAFLKLKGDSHHLDPAVTQLGVNSCTQI